MNRVAFAIVLLFGFASFACAGESQPSNGTSSQPDSEPATESSPSPEADLVKFGVLASLDESLVVAADANIYGAGRKYPPGPGGGGGGTLPPGWRLAKSTGSIVTFPTVTGRVTPIEGSAEMNGPEGTLAYDTFVEAYKGISGIDHRGRQMFLVGLFLANTRQRSPAPPALDFTKRPTADLVAPRIGQVFLVGDGTDYRYKVPRGASRLFLGFADGAYGGGPVGWYSNNAGHLEASVELSKR